MEFIKNNEYIVDIIDMGIEAEGIAKIDGYTIFIKNALVGEKIKIKLIKANKNYGFGKIIEIIEKSKDRVKPFCKCFEKCGGCNLQHLDYSKQLEYKLNIVKNNFRKFGLDDNKIKEIIGMENPINYRNKAQYPYGIDKDGNIVTGFYAARTHSIIQNDGCNIEHNISELINKEIYNLIKKQDISVYNEKSKKGYLRHVIIKVGFSTNEIMVVFVTNSKENKLDKITKEITEKFKNIKTVVQNINITNSNVILGDKNILLYGNGYIQDYIGKYKFNISPMSFYQVNPIQTEKLYAKVKEYVGKKADTLFDLYCGVGTIGIYCSEVTQNLYGIEVVKQAIDDAKENAKINNIQNAHFFAGEAENEIDKLYDKGIKADTIIVDPPRKGLDKKIIDVFLEKEPNKIVYVSCNNATLCRDLELLKDKYEVKECTLFDLFPHTRTCRVLCSIRKSKIGEKNELFTN